jgi:hypothetical protein
MDSKPCQQLTNAIKVVAIVGQKCPLQSIHQAIIAGKIPGFTRLGKTQAVGANRSLKN